MHYLMVPLLLKDIRISKENVPGLCQPHFGGLLSTKLLVIPTNIVISRDNYNSLTSAKFPPKNDDGQLKFICVDKKADKINILIDKVISLIRTMAALEVIITVYPRVVW